MHGRKNKGDIMPRKYIKKTSEEYPVSKKRIS
jgi:hypothetical protein